MACGQALNSSINVLLVSDKNLGAAGEEIVARYFGNVSTLIWSRGDKAGKAVIGKTLERRTWDLLISFYNDFVFSESQLNRAGVALNIHPALPSIRGMGYDTLPLIHGHSRCGATLHFMTPELDAGEIIRVVSSRLGPDMTHSTLRAASQRHSRALLDWLCQLTYTRQTRDEIRAVLTTHSGTCDHQWSADYLSRDRHQALIERLRRESPGHPALR